MTYLDIVSHNSESGKRFFCCPKSFRNIDHAIGCTWLKIDYHEVADVISKTLLAWEWNFVAKSLRIWSGAAIVRPWALWQSTPNWGLKCCVFLFRRRPENCGQCQSSLPVEPGSIRQVFGVGECDHLTLQANLSASIEWCPVVFTLQTVFR